MIMNSIQSENEFHQMKLNMYHFKLYTVFNLSNIVNSFVSFTQALQDFINYILVKYMDLEENIKRN